MEGNAAKKPKSKPKAQRSPSAPRRAAAGQASAKTRKVDAVEVSDGALATIVGLAAHEVPGVVGMAPASLTEGIRRILGARQVDEGVVLDRGGPDRAGVATVDLHVVVAYGVNIPVVAEQIRKRVEYAAKRYAGVELHEVTVHVDGVSRA